MQLQELKREEEEELEARAMTYWTMHVFTHPEIDKNHVDHQRELMYNEWMNEMKYIIGIQDV